MRQSHLVGASVLAAALAAATATVSAQAKPEAQTQPVAPQLAPGLPAKPYLRLFEQQQSKAAAALRSQMRSSFMRPNSARRFICGTPVLPAESAVDPTFEMRPPATTTRFSMRFVAPGQCH